MARGRGDGVLRHALDRRGRVPGRPRLHHVDRPGPDVKELEIEPADRPALEMARVPRFQETVYYIRDLIAQLEGRVEQKSK